MTLPLDVLLRTAGVAIGLVFVLVVALRGGWRQRGDLLAVVGCGVAYLVCSAPDRPCCSSPATLPLLLGAIGFPFAFWRLARVVLEDDPRVPPAAWAGLAVLLASGLVAAADHLQAPPGWRAGAGALNKVAAFAFVGAALHAAWRSWSGDLVAPRRKLRWVLVGYLGAYGLVIMAGEIYLLGDRPPAWLDLLNAAVIDLTLLVTLLYLIQPRPAAMETLFSPATVQRPAPPISASIPVPQVDAGDEPLRSRLHELMAGQKLYRDPDLSVWSLATRAGVPEYVLRRLIHERLGHRHFAAYVNDHRLREVAERLVDPQLARRPILTLALEAGFGSIGPFNRAFRERYGVTPSEYRAGAPDGDKAAARAGVPAGAGANLP